MKKTPGAEGTPLDPPTAPGPRPRSSQTALVDPKVSVLSTLRRRRLGVSFKRQSIDINLLALLYMIIYMIICYDML